MLTYVLGNPTDRVMGYDTDVHPGGWPVSVCYVEMGPFSTRGYHSVLRLQGEFLVQLQHSVTGTCMPVRISEVLVCTLAYLLVKL